MVENEEDDSDTNHLNTFDAYWYDKRIASLSAGQLKDLIATSNQESSNQIESE